ncbi:MAG: hypothetical protein D6715_02515 [Calditrichaeota bacterium]|nr:MAG: hypothetical protein D6715_02515 [Calditrichota bacterium]
MSAGTAFFRRHWLPELLRDAFALGLGLTIVQKLFNPAQFADFTRFVGLLSRTYDVPLPFDLLWIFRGIIVLEALIVLGLYGPKTLRLSLWAGGVWLLLGIGISLLSLYAKLHSACGCGLFGDNPYLLLGEKVLLLLLLLGIVKYRR